MGKASTAKVTWDQVFAWRMGRQGLLAPIDGGAVEVVRRLAGVQAQVSSSAAASIAVRQERHDGDEVDRLLAEGRLMRTWAMRGTLHLLPPDDAAAFLSLLAAGRFWERGSWQRVAITTSQLAALADAVTDLLSGAVLTREQLMSGIATLTGDQALADKVQSGWSSVLKPLAWQGLLCNGPPLGRNVTFTSPSTWLKGWKGLPSPEEAATVAVPAYLGAHGPASPAIFDQWLTRGLSKRAALRGWFADLGDALADVVVDGESLHVRAEDLDDLMAAKPDGTVRLLPGFDQYVLGPGTADIRLIPEGRRSRVSKTAGWIAPVVIAKGRVAGTWTAEDGRVTVELFKEAGRIAKKDLQGEAVRLVGDEVKLSVMTV